MGGFAHLFAKGSNADENKSYDHEIVNENINNDNRQEQLTSNINNNNDQ